MNTSTTVAVAAADLDQSQAGDDEVLHIVTNLEWFLADVLRLWIPRPLCGASLLTDDDQDDESDLPVCPRCQLIDSRRRSR